VNEDDEMLSTSITKEKDQKSVLIIERIQSIPIGSSTQVGGTDEEKVQLAETIVEEEKEKILNSILGEKEENTIE
jgi:hypothetical protein